MNVTVNSAADLADMPPEYRDALAHQVLAHASGELSGGDHYRELLDHAPNAYELQVLYAAAADEIGHYRLAADVLAGMGIDSSYMLKQKLGERKDYPDDFIHVHSNWAERGLTSMLAESAALEHLIDFKESSYRPFAAIIDQTIREESVHISNGYRIVSQFCETNEGRAQVQAVLEKKWGQVLDLFGRSDSTRSKVFLQWGLRQRTNEEARKAFIARKRPKLKELGLVVRTNESIVPTCET